MSTYISDVHIRMRWNGFYEIHTLTKYLIKRKRKSF
jgi:hypothetical protein